MSNLKQTEAAILPLEIDMRQAEDAPVRLVGHAAGRSGEPAGHGAHSRRLRPRWPSASRADLLRRRPDVRQAERLAAAQGRADRHRRGRPCIPPSSSTARWATQPQNFPDLFRPTAFNGSVGPSFQWNLLNYGRIVNNVRSQDAQFQELVVAYQQTVLQASQQVEDGLVTFLRSQQQAKLCDESVTAAKKAVKIVVLQYRAGRRRFQPLRDDRANLVTQQALGAQARGQIAQGLVATYRALGGGWEIRLGDEARGPGPEAANPPAAPNRPAREATYTAAA